MKTIIPNGKGGIAIVEVAKPELFDNAVLCRATHSLISTGTERLMIRGAEGLAQADIVRQGTRLGYCGAGIVEEVRGAEMALTPGQRVAYYGGPYVSHSEFVAVPRHLAYPIPESLDARHAVFMGIGAIALHGFRKARLELGETCFVAGAGVIGNLCAQFAVVAGCRVVVSDSNRERLDILARCVGDKADVAFTAPGDVPEGVGRMSGGLGADAALLCVSTASSTPMEQAVAVVIPGGRIVVVGVFDIVVPREPFFQKEAEITISRAGGPGRYDPRYEREGVDYPPQYARWTESRNLDAVLRLIAESRLRVDPLISRSLPVARAHEAYKEIMEGKDRSGIILEWAES